MQYYRLLVFSTALGFLLPTTSLGRQHLTLYAAASLAPALSELLPPNRFPNLRISYASSSTLARQIVAGAPADIYFSASQAWMDYLVDSDFVENSTLTNILCNNLVAIAPRGEVASIILKPDFPIANAFVGRLALGNPEHVPVGIYAKQALKHLQWWDQLRTRLAPAPDARAALVYVEQGACSLGIVYGTDAASSDRVDIVATFPDSLHEQIRYPVAAVSGRATAAVRHVLTHLCSLPASEIFLRYGFTIPAPDTL